MNASTWLLDPKVRQAVHQDDVCRTLVDAMHDAMASRGITPSDLARHLGVAEHAIKDSITDPLSLRLSDLVRLLDTLNITLTPTPRAA